MVPVCVGATVKLKTLNVIPTIIRILSYDRAGQLDSEKHPLVVMRNAGHFSGTTLFFFFGGPMGLRESKVQG